MEANSLEEIIGYSFNDKALLTKALSHSSYANEKHLSYNMCNERLEFLGDAVLELVSSTELFSHYPEKKEGELSTIRASLVCESALDKCARKINLSEYILLGKGEMKTGGNNRPSILSDCMEALIGAIYIDGGLEKTADFIKKFILFDIDKITVFVDNKTALQERMQAVGKSPTYILIREEGPDHNKTFVMACMDGDTEIGRGEGHSKKAAEQMAAKEALGNITG